MIEHIKQRQEMLLDTLPEIKSKYDYDMFQRIVELADRIGPEETIVDIRCALIHYDEKFIQRRRSQV